MEDFGFEGEGYGEGGGYFGIDEKSEIKMYVRVGEMMWTEIVGAVSCREDEMLSN